MCQTIDLKKSLSPQRLTIVQSDLSFQQMIPRRCRKLIVGQSNTTFPRPCAEKRSLLNLMK